MQGSRNRSTPTLDSRSPCKFNLLICQATHTTKTTHAINRFVGRTINRNARLLDDTRVNWISSKGRAYPGPPLTLFYYYIFIIPLLLLYLLSLLTISCHWQSRKMSRVLNEEKDNESFVHIFNRAHSNFSSTRDFSFQLQKTQQQP